MKSKKLLSFKQDLIENSAFMTNEFITSASNSFFSSLWHDLQFLFKYEK